MSADKEDVPEGTDPRGVGLIAKYKVFKIVHGAAGETYEPVEEQVFVMKPSTDPAAQAAMLAYSAEVLKDGKINLANDIMDWIQRIWDQARVEDRIKNLKSEDEKGRQPRPNERQS